VPNQAGDLSGKVIVSCSLPMNRDDTELIIGRTWSGSEKLGMRGPLRIARYTEPRRGRGADGSRVFDFWQAQGAVRQWALRIGKRARAVLVSRDFAETLNVVPLRVARNRNPPSLPRRGLRRCRTTKMVGSPSVGAEVRSGFAIWAELLRHSTPKILAR
jgi:hypothetical protein